MVYSKMPVHVCSAVRGSFALHCTKKKKKKGSEVHHKWILKRYPVFVSPIDAWEKLSSASLTLMTITLDPELFNNTIEG